MKFILAYHVITERIICRLNIQMKDHEEIVKAFIYRCNDKRIPLIAQSVTIWIWQAAVDSLYT